VIWKRHAVSIALVVLAAVLGVYVLVVDRRAPTTGEVRAREKNLFPVFRRDEIAAIEIDRGGASIRIARGAADGGSAPYVLAPVQGDSHEPQPADQAAVQSLVSALETAVPQRWLSSDLDRHALGLDAPRLRLALSMGAITYRLAVGNAAPTPAGAAYAELSGQGVLVLAHDLVADLSRPRDAYRSRSLAPYPTRSLQRIELRDAKGLRRLSRAGWGGWQIDLGAGTIRVDRRAFETIQASLDGLSAETFLAENDAEAAIGADAGRVRVSMVPGASQPRAVLDVGGRCRVDDGGSDHDGAAVVRLEPGRHVAACVAEAVAGALGTPADVLADRHLFSLRPDEVEEISFVSGGKRTEIARQGTSWHVRFPAEGELDVEEGNALAQSLLDLAAERVDPGRAGEAFAERGSVTVLQGGGSEAEQTIRVGTAGAGGLVAALRVQDGARLAISRDAADALLPGPLTLKSRKIIDTVISGVRAISVRRDGTVERLRRSATGTWTLVEPRGFAPDPGLADDLVGAVAELRADRWIAERDDGSYGLSDPSRTVDLEVWDADAGARTIHLEVGRSVGRGAAARIVGEPGVFVLSEATLRAIDAWAIDRSVFMIDPGSVRRIDVGSGKRLEGGDFDAAKEALSTLRAEGVVHLGKPTREEGFDRPQLELSIRLVSGSARITIGAGDVWRETNVFYARRDGVDATFAIARSKVRPLLDLR
jgi:Domain of unknown function (DUF4340)